MLFRSRHGALVACGPAPLDGFTPGRVTTTVVGARLQAPSPSLGQHGAVTHMQLQGVGIAYIRGWGERMFPMPIIPQKRGQLNVEPLHERRVVKRCAIEVPRSLVVPTSAVGWGATRGEAARCVRPPR